MPGEVGSRCKFKSSLLALTLSWDLEKVAAPAPVSPSVRQDLAQSREDGLRPHMRSTGQSTSVQHTVGALKMVALSGLQALKTLRPESLSGGTGVRQSAGQKRVSRRE